MRLTLKVASDFSPSPGPRFLFEGKYSGQEFREKHLYPQLVQAIKEDAVLTVDLDGTSGFGTSFLEESFGGLIRNNKLNLCVVRKHLEFKSIEEPELIDEVMEYMEDAQDEFGGKV